jgi:plasmid maintenance system antidote protein VapI
MSTYSYDKIPLFSTIGHRPLPLMALRLSRLFGNSPDFMLRAQQARDLWEKERRCQKELAQIQALDAD